MVELLQQLCEFSGDKDRPRGGDFRDRPPLIATVAMQFPRLHLSRRRLEPVGRHQEELLPFGEPVPASEIRAVPVTFMRSTNPVRVRRTPRALSCIQTSQRGMIESYPVAYCRTTRCTRRPALKRDPLSCALNRRGPRERERLACGNQLAVDRCPSERRRLALD